MPGRTVIDRSFQIASWVALGLVVGAWLADAAGSGLPAVVDRSLILLASLVWLVRGLRWAVPALRTGPGWTPGRVLLALLPLSLLTGLVGIDFELMDHPRNDEGVFYAQALRINEGELLPATYNYGHVPYYLDALLLWTHDLFPGPARAVAGALYDIDRPNPARRLTLRARSGLLGALTLIPVFWAAYRIAGLGAAALSGALILFATVYVQVAHVVIADVPAGFFAACCLPYCARLMERETAGDYARAGIAAALAAASKYPGGVVAVAIVGVWLAWRIRTRSWSWGLVLSGAVSLATFLAVMPSLWLDWRAAFAGEGLDVLFGFRQYARGGWLGAIKSSLPLWYGERLVESFGWAALVGGLGGLVFVGRRSAWRLVSVVPYAVVYLSLIGSMKMAVLRNLQPVLPAAAIVLGVGLAAWSRPLGRGPKWLPAVLAAGVLALPVVRTLSWDLKRTRPGTRQLATEWVAENVVQGAGLLGEDYTPEPDSRRYHWHRIRFAPRMPLAELFSGEWDYLLLADAAHGRFLDREALTKEGQRAIHDVYRRLFELPVEAEFSPGPLTAGPTLTIYRVEPPETTYRSRRRFTLADAHFVSDPRRMRRQGPSGPIRFTRETHYAVFKEYLRAGSYRAEADFRPDPGNAVVHVVTRDGRTLGRLPLAGAARFTVEEPQKVLFRVFALTRRNLHGFAVRRVGPVEGERAPDATAGEREGGETSPSPS